MGWRDRDWAKFNDDEVQIPAAPQPVVIPASRPRVMRIVGTRILQRGGTFTLSGRHAPQAGSIEILGRWGAGAWETIAVANGLRPTYSLRIPLTRTGVLRLKIRYPDGSSALGTYRVE